VAKLIFSAAMLATLFAHPATAHADGEPDETNLAALADEAGVDKTDLAGALSTLHAAGIAVSAREYLFPLVVPSISGALAARVACIESRESGGANVANRGGSGASGVLQYMPGTFRAHAAEMGHFDWSPWTPWQARAVAAHDLALGRRAQWTVRGC
jgi:hypothetical protein